VSFPVVLSPLRYESVPADRTAKIADFIGTIPTNGLVGFSVFLYGLFAHSFKMDIMDKQMDKIF
jgi:hypothetical protein